MFCADALVGLGKLPVTDEISIDLTGVADSSSCVLTAARGPLPLGGTKSRSDLDCQTIPGLPGEDQQR